MTDGTTDAAESAPPQAVARRLERVTFDYSATQDRLLARMQASDGERHAAWLTQRLARRLVKALLSHLDKTVTAEQAVAATPSVGGGTAGPGPKEMLLSFRHQAALIKREPSPPVADVDTRDLPLLESIHARLTQHRALLTMDLPVGPAVLSLSHDHAWQLLQILLNIFRKADWPVDAWPAWMRDGDSAAARAADTQVLH